MSVVVNDENHSFILPITKSPQDNRYHHHSDEPPLRLSIRRAITMPGEKIAQGRSIGCTSLLKNRKKKLTQEPQVTVFLQKSGEIICKVLIECICRLKNWKRKQPNKELEMSTYTGIVPVLQDKTRAKTEKNDETTTT
jgi:hypothetical protein